MTKTAALELGVHGIRVNSLHPGGVNTFMTNPTEEPVEVVDTWFHNVRAAAGWAVRRSWRAWRCSSPSDESSYCTGAEFVVDGGWTCGDLTPQLPGLPDFTSR